MSSSIPQASPGASSAEAKPTLLICSSSEAIQRGIVPSLISELDKRSVLVEIKSWADEFPDGEFTLETLLRLANQVDMAVLIFSKDDRRQVRGKRDNVTRDNVLLEYGLFLGKLDRSRVFIFLEEGVTLPSDLKGLTVSVFKKTSQSIFKADVHHFVTSIADRLPLLSIGPDPIGPPPGPDPQPVAAELGIASILKEGQANLDKLKEKISNYASSDKSISEPFIIASSDLSIATYVEALSLVKWRFWTTSYLSSGFWIQPRSTRIFDANQKMLEGLKQSNRDVRRLFLVERGLAEEIQARKQDYIHLRHQQQQSEIEKRKDELQELRDTCLQLEKEGCQMRVAYQANAHKKNLPDVIAFQKGDSEVAIYDDFRVDYFSGGAVGSITEVKIYSKATDFFQLILDRSKAYFETLWNAEKTKSITDFLNDLEAAYHAAEKQIDYTAHWRAEYEYNLRPEDQNLKTEEMNMVKNVLQQHKRWGKVYRYLDIGTGTARYPIGLREAVTAHGKIIGIDNDVDCISFAQDAKQKAGGDPRIDVQLIDFGAKEITTSLGSFDLITCMLGTISHFGWNRKNDLTDELQLVINRVAKLLQQDGLFIVSNWSQYACSRLDMIQIYKESDKKRLAAWTPDRTDLRRRLIVAGLEVLEEIIVESRLEIFVCRKG